MFKEKKIVVFDRDIVGYGKDIVLRGYLNNEGDYDVIECKVVAFGEYEIIVEYDDYEFIRSRTITVQEVIDGKYELI